MHAHVTGIIKEEDKKLKRNWKENIRGVSWELGGMEIMQKQHSFMKFSEIKKFKWVVEYKICHVTVNAGLDLPFISIVKWKLLQLEE